MRSPLQSAIFQPPPDPRTLRIVPMGGCGEFGMNITAYLYGGKCFIVDCGLRFTDPTKLGTDAVVPAVDPWFEESGGVTAYLLTHGHEDHLGALPYILPRWPAPVYATPWTAALLRNKYAKLGLSEEQFPITVVRGGDRVRTDGFDAEYVPVNHSIPDACALFIRTPALNVFHTGDFKIDRTPIIEPPIDESRLAALGAEGVDLLLADSTNADKRGYCPSETTVREPLERVVRAADGAVVVTTFASNLWRLKTVVDVCLATGRRLFVSGPGVELTFSVARELGLYAVPDGLRVSEDQVAHVDRSRLLVLATGCQGEFRSAMSRIAWREHRAFRIAPGDTVVLSSRIIPGNERSIITMLDQLRRQGARIVTPRDAEGIHVSGHAYGGDLDRLFELLKPRFFTPVHGAYGQLAGNRERSLDQGMPPDDAIIIETGDVLDCRRRGIDHVGRIEVGLEYIDGDSGVPIPYEALRERLRIGELGLATLGGVFDRRTGSWLAPPTVELQGIRLPADVDLGRWMDRHRAAVDEAVRALVRDGAPSDDIKEELRILTRRALAAELRKKPVVLVNLQLVTSA